MEDHNEVLNPPHVKDIKANPARLVKCVAQIAEITEADNGSIVVTLCDTEDATQTAWINEAYWAKLGKRFKEGDYVVASFEKRVAGKTTFLNEDKELVYHTKDGMSFNSMVKSTEAQFMRAMKSNSVDADIAIITAADPAYAGAVAQYLAARK
jgi:hypothetical protein